MSGTRCRAQASGDSEVLELGLEHRLVPGPDAVHDDDVARCLGELLGQGAQRGDADPGSQEQDLAGAAALSGQPAVGALDQHPGAGAKLAGLAAAVPEVFHGDPQRGSRGRGGQRVRVGAAGAWAGQEPQQQELPGADGELVEVPAGQVHRDHPRRLGHDRGDGQPVPQRPVGRQREAVEHHRRCGARPC